VKKRWRAYASKIDAMTLRERTLLFVALAFVVGFIMNVLLIDPQTTRIKAMSNRMAQQQVELQTLGLKIKTMQTQMVSADAGHVMRQKDINAQIAAIDNSLNDLQHKLVPAQSMKAVLQEVLTRNSRVELVAMRTLPVMPLVEKHEKTDKTIAAPPAKPADLPVKQDAAAANAGNVFKHGAQITVQGSYADLYDYVTRLERLQSRMFWARANLSAEDYPRLTLTLTVYTLSLDKAWLEI
jgi:MSHA biogenesis protein MshJ